MVWKATYSKKKNNNKKNSHSRIALAVFTLSEIENALHIAIIACEPFHFYGVQIKCKDGVEITKHFMLLAVQNCRSEFN